MSAEHDTDRRYVTTWELKEEIDEVRKEIDKRPTSAEVRFLILAGMVAANMLPISAPEIARAAFGMIWP